MTLMPSIRHLVYFSKYTRRESGAVARGIGDFTKMLMLHDA